MRPLDDLPIVQMSPVLREDVNQEAELLKLQGITPNRRILALRMQQRELTFSGPLEDARPIPQLGPSQPTEDVLEALVDWTLEQISEVQAQMFEFLENPDDLFDETISLLRGFELITGSQKPPKELAFADILRSNLPATRQELYRMGRELLPTTRRPEATVRQWIRRMLRDDSIDVTDDVITWKG